MTRALAYTALAALFLISLTYRIRDVTDRLDETLHGMEYVRDPFTLDGPSLTVTRAQPEADHAGLRPGDVVIVIAGRPATGSGPYHVALRQARAGDRLSVRAQTRMSAATFTRDTSIVLRPMQDTPPNAAQWLIVLLVNVALPFSCMALGFWVAAVRVHDGRAWLVLLVLLSLAEFAGGNPRTLSGRQDLFQPIAAAYQPLLANIWPTAMFLFAIYFPDRLPFDRRFPWAKWLIAGPLLLRVLVRNVPTAVLANHHAALAEQIRRLDPLTPYAGQAQFFALALFFVIMAWRRTTATSPDTRRRLAILFTGATVAVLPVLLGFVVAAARGVQVTTLPPWTLVVIVGALFVFPLTMAHVIVVDRAMDVRVVVRQGLRYLLARGGVRALQLAISAAIIVIAAGGTSGPFTRPGMRILLVGAGFAALIAIHRSADVVRQWVDRRFFREAYDAERILSDLAGQVRTMVETAPLLETVARRISDSLHVPRIAILLNSGGRLEPAHALGYPAPPEVMLPEESVTARRLLAEPHARVRLDDPASWTQQAGEEERASLARLESELLLPLTLNQKLVGLISLGAKRSEEPFSGSDIRLLDSVAAQTGLALENSRLTAEIATEVANREKARRELEIAREVQERLFPQDYPAVPGLDYAGACRPALGIGGDYYDFVHLSDSKLGIAIGDVSGKGIPAALLMATLRAYLRGQTIRGGSDLASMMTSLNALVYESSASNRYATFFYGQYDARTRVLRYVNGGHNPPMVFRGDTCEVARLDTGGPVIGLLPDCAYTQGEITLHPGDMLVAFTDGISEAMNAAMEDWGEERLERAIHPHRTLPAHDVIERIMHEADAFAGGAPQHDDMTVVVVRLSK